MTATFQLEEDDRRALAAAYGAGVVTSADIVVARSYDDRFHWQIELDEKPAAKVSPRSRIATCRTASAS